MPEEKQSEEDQLIEDVASFWHDPLGYVLYAFPWGEGELENCSLEDWQRELLDEIGKNLRAGTMTVQGSLVYAGKAICGAVASGHGIGKSAFVAMLIMWALSTMEDTKGVITANTKTQLSTKTWSELAKWHRLCINSHWFKYESTSIHSIDPRHEKTWRIDAVPWSSHNTEAFAGLHNKGKRIILLFDEASAIDDKIFEVSEGALTDKNTEIIWFVFGNPTRNNGRFRECWRRFRSIFKIRRQIDSREVRITNKENIKEKVALYGDDSDYIRVRVKGIFPRQSDRQFISSELVEAARGKHVKEAAYKNAPKILTLDNAWTGGDEIVIGLRQGPIFQILMTLEYNDDDIQIAQHLARFEDEHEVDAVFIDAGFGTGVYSAGKHLKRNWILVHFGSKSGTPGYNNKRAEMWGLGKDWLRSGGCIPDDDVLCEDLIGPEFEIVGMKSEILLESKKHMKERGVPSPNRADAWALSFAFPVAPRPRSHEHRARREFANGGTSGEGYDPFA